MSFPRTIRQRLGRTKAELKRRIYRHPGALARLVRYPVPVRSPRHAKQLDLKRNKGLGDVLMCTPALRELKRVNPNCYIRFYTDFVSLIDGLPYIDEVHHTQLAPANALYLGYENSTPPQGSLPRILGDLLGVNVTDVKPDCVVKEEVVESVRAALQIYPRPYQVILRRASAWTPNKDWPDGSWNVVAESLSREGTVIEIGGETGVAPDGTGAYLDWRGRTTIEEVVALLSISSLYLGPVSGPMHIAAAVGTPRVVVYGGYEHPIGQAGYEHLSAGGYRDQISLYSPVPCAPCWLTEACPYGRKCLTMIEPHQVVAAARTLLQSSTVHLSSAMPEMSLP